MRIVIPIRRYCNGEAAMNRLIGYAKGFAHYGVEVWIYFFITNKDEERLMIENPYIHIRYLWEKDGKFFKKHRVLELAKNMLIFRKEIQKEDFLFLYGRANYFFLLAWSLRKRCKVFSEITEHPNYLGTNCLRKLDVDISYIFLRSFNGLFVISNNLRQHFISKGLNERRVNVINMFVDLDRFKGVKQPINEKYIAYCGSVSKKKDGVDILIKSYAIFQNKHPEYSLYIIGGSGDDEPLDYFKNLSRELNVFNKIVFTGKIPAEKMPSLLCSASILALSRPDSLQARNGFPTKLGEYLATGVPVVVTNVGEISSFIIDGVNGIVAAESSVEDFANKLNWVANNTNEAKKIGERGKELAKNEFSNVLQSHKALELMRLL